MSIICKQDRERWTKYANINAVEQGMNTDGLEFACLAAV